MVLAGCMELPDGPHDAAEPAADGRYSHNETILFEACTSSACYGSASRSFEKFTVARGEAERRNVSYEVRWSSPFPAPTELQFRVFGSSADESYRMSGPSPLSGTLELRAGATYSTSVSPGGDSSAVLQDVEIRLTGPIRETR